MPTFLISQVGRNMSPNERDRSRYIGYVECADALGMCDVTDVAGKATYELAGILPSLLLFPLVTRGEVNLKLHRYYPVALIPKSPGSFPTSMEGL